MLTHITDTSAQDNMLPKAKNFWSKVRILVLLCGIIAALLIAVRDFSSTNNIDQVIEKQRVRLASVTRGEFIQDVMTQGRVVTGNSPTLFSPESGFVQLHVKAGDHVTQHQLLAEIVSPSLNERLDQEIALLHSKESELEREKLEIKRRKFTLRKAENLARVNFKALEREKQRGDKLIAKQLISLLNYERMVDDRDRAQLEFKLARDNNVLETESLSFELTMAEQSLQAQQLTVASLERRVAQLQIRSPARGLIGKIEVRDSQAVNSYQALLSVVDLTRFEIEAPVPENSADDLLPGMAVEIKLNNQKYAGELLAVSPEVSQNLVTTRIGFIAPIPDNLRQNQRLSVRILIAKKPHTLMVERGSFVDSFEGSVFVVNDDIAVRRAVVLGDRSYGFIEVVSGLELGETIISSNVSVDRKSKRLLIRN